MEMRSKDRALLRNLVLASIAGTVGSLAIAASCLSGAKVDGVAASSSDAITETVSSRNGGAPTTQPVVVSGAANASTETSNGSVRSSAGGIASPDTAGLTTTTGAEIPPASIQPPEGQGPAIAAGTGAFAVPENPIRALPPGIATPAVATASVGQTPAAAPTSPTPEGADVAPARVSRPDEAPNQSVAPTNDLQTGGASDGGSSALTRDPRVAAPATAPAPTSTSPFATDAPPWATSSWTSNPEAGAGRFTTEWNIPGGFTPALPIIPLTDIR